MVGGWVSVQEPAEVWVGRWRGRLAVWAYLRVYYAKGLRGYASAGKVWARLACRTLVLALQHAVPASLGAH